MPCCRMYMGAASLLIESLLRLLHFGFVSIFYSTGLDAACKLPPEAIDVPAMTSSLQRAHVCLLSRALPRLLRAGRVANAPRVQACFASGIAHCLVMSLSYSDPSCGEISFMVVVSIVCIRQPALPVAHAGHGQLLRLTDG
jgi:hypothetical protein